MLNRYCSHIALLIALPAAYLAAACRSTPAPPAATVSADTWAVVDGREITRDYVEKAYRRTGGGSPELSDEEALTAKLTLLNEVIVQEILVAKAGQLKIELTDKELDTAYAEARKNIPEEAFQKELTRRNLTAADMREGLRRELLSQKVVERELQSKVVVTDQEVRDFFNANRARFNFPEEAYHIAQIAITPQRDPQTANRLGDDAATPQAAAAKARMLMERLKAGASFSDLAMDYSEDPQSAPRGGDLGFVPMSRLQQVPPLLAQRGAEEDTGHGQSGEPGRFADYRAGGRPRGGGSTGSVDAGRARKHHGDASRAPGTTAARGLLDCSAERRADRQLPGATTGRIAGQDTGPGACRADRQVSIDVPLLRWVASGAHASRHLIAWFARRDPDIDPASPGFP